MMLRTILTFGVGWFVGAKIKEAEMERQQEAKPKPALSDGGASRRKLLPAPDCIMSRDLAGEGLSDDGGFPDELLKKVATINDAFAELGITDYYAVCSRGNKIRFFKLSSNCNPDKPKGYSLAATTVAGWMQKRYGLSLEKIKQGDYGDSELKAAKKLYSGGRRKKTTKRKTTAKRKTASKAGNKKTTAKRNPKPKQLPDADDEVARTFDKKGDELERLLAKATS